MQKLLSSILVLSVLSCFSVIAQVITDFKVGETVYYKHFGKCYKAKVTRILNNVPGYGKRIKILTESDDSSKKSNLMVDGSMKNTSLNVDPKELSRKSDCGIISKEGFKVGDTLYYKDFTGKCKKVEVKNILNASMISVYLLDGSNSMRNVNPKDLSKEIPCN